MKHILRKTTVGRALRAGTGGVEAILACVRGTPRHDGLPQCARRGDRVGWGAREWGEVRRSGREVLLIYLRKGRTMDMHGRVCG
jgi:hypothetical protein